jgi:hypothetical protein
MDDIGIQQVWIYSGKYYREPFHGEPMPVVVKKDEISYDGTNYIPITKNINTIRPAETLNRPCELTKAAI